MAFFKKITYLCATECRISTSVVHWLPKPRRRVRLPYPAPDTKKPALSAPAFLYSFILSFSPEKIVSGLSSITADSSPAMQKPHLSQIPSDSPMHCGLRVPSV